MADLFPDIIAIIAEEIKYYFTNGQEKTVEKLMSAGKDTLFDMRRQRLI